MRSNASGAPRARGARGASTRSIGVKDVIGEIVLDHDEHMRPQTDMQSLGGLNPASRGSARMPGFDGMALQKYPELERIHHVHTGGNSSGIVDGAAAVLIGNREMGEKHGIKPRAQASAAGVDRQRADDHADRPRFVTEKLLKRAGMTPATSTCWS